MKAFLLAAGKGTRLRPITDQIPKCLVPIQGKPLLKIWLEHLARYGVEEVLINTHHLADQIRAFVQNNRDGMPQIRLAYEPVLLGSGGTVRANRDFVDQDEDFFIIYADNLTDLQLSDMLRYHRQQGGILTMGLFESATPEACGIAEIDPKGKDRGLIVSFEEKPKKPKGSLANAGIYVASQQIFDFFPTEQIRTASPLDFGHHILPKLVGYMYGYVLDSFLMDIGTFENYELAQRIWSNRA